MVSAWLGLFELMTKTLNVELDVIPTVFYCYHLDLEYVQKEVKKKKTSTEDIRAHKDILSYILNRGAELNKHLGLKDKGDHPAT